MEDAYRAHVKYCMRTRFLSLRPPCLPLHPLYTTRRVGYIPPNPQGDTVLRTAPAVGRYRLEEAFVPVSASVSALIFPCGEREKRLQYSGYLETDTYCIRRAVPSAKSPDVRRAHGPHRAIVEGSALPLHPFTEEVVVPAIGHQVAAWCPRRSDTGVRVAWRFHSTGHRWAFVFIGSSCRYRTACCPFRWSRSACRIPVLPSHMECGIPLPTSGRRDRSSGRFR